MPQIDPSLEHIRQWMSERAHFAWDNEKNWIHPTGGGIDTIYDWEKSMPMKWGNLNAFRLPVKRTQDEKMILNNLNWELAYHGSQLTIDP